MSTKKTFRNKFRQALKSFKRKIKKFLSTQTRAKVAALSLAIFALLSAATIGGGELYKGYFSPIDRATVDEIRRTLDENQQRQTVTPHSYTINPPQQILPDNTLNLDFNLDDFVLDGTQVYFSNFKLTSPVNQSINEPLRPTFRWENLPTNLPSNTRMFINLATSNNFPVHSTKVFQVTNINQPFTLPNNLTPNTTYYWFVQFNINGELRSINIINSFRTTDTTESAVLLIPTNLASNVSTTPTFTWQAVTNPATYRLQVSRGNDMNNVIADINNLTSTSYTIPANNQLQNASVYTWRVIATRSTGTTYNYPQFKFTTEANQITPTPPPTPTPPAQSQDVFINFTSTTSSVIEANTTVNIEVTLSSPLSYNLDVPYTLRSSSTATINQDFTLPTNRFVTFNAGTTRQSIPVRIIDDNIREFDETVVLRLNAFNFASNVKIGSRNEHTLTIIDNDGGLAQTPVSPGTKVSCEKYFIDVDRFHPLCEQLTYLRELEIFRGQATNQGNRADLNSQLKRSEYFAVAARLLGRDKNRVTSLNPVFRFRDMTPSIVNNPNNSWWLTATVQLDEIIRGFGPDNFKTLEAERVTTEAEIAKVALEGKFREFRNRDFIEPWFTDTLNFMADYGFYIDPTRPATRGDAVEILYVILQIEQDRNFYRNFAF